MFTRNSFIIVLHVLFCSSCYCIMMLKHTYYLISFFKILNDVLMFFLPKDIDCILVVLNVRKSGQISKQAFPNRSWSIVACPISMLFISVRKHIISSHWPNNILFLNGIKKFSRRRILKLNISIAFIEMIDQLIKIFILLESKSEKEVSSDWN